MKFGRELLIGVLVSVIIAVLSKLFSKSDEKMTETKYTPGLIKSEFEQLKKEYGEQIASAVERQFRLETAHFKSTGFLNTNGAGALAYPNKKGFGWGVATLKKYGITSYWSYKFPDGKVFNYLVFPSLYSALKFSADYIKKFPSINDGLKAWGGFAEYPNRVNQIKNKFV